MNTISGKTEFDIFKNYYTVEKQEKLKLMVNILPLQSKDDVEAERLRGLVKVDFRAKKYYVCLEKYTECLRYATWNGREYAMALANRSAIYFAMDNYKHCLVDINLSLQADYPIKLKPKVLIRRAKCFIKMGELKKMMETIDDCCKQIQGYANLSKTDKENYLTELKSLMKIKQMDINELPFEETSLALEVIKEENQLNPNVSASIKMKYNKKTGTDYVAARDIKCGEVLFVDKAYAIGFVHEFKMEEEPYSNGIFFCDYCRNEAKNCIPCKFCVNVVYCSENCRLNSWTDYHQWECDMIRSRRLEGEFCLALRTVIKAAFSGAIFEIANNKHLKPSKPSKDLDPYFHIYSLHLDFVSFRSKCTKKFVESCERTVLMVEFLKKANFFTHLMSTTSCREDYPTLVNLFGGLLFRHNVQMYQRMLTMNCTSSTVSLNEYQDLELLFVRNTKFNAFCPAVSGLEFSCQSNTSMYFNGSICIVKACKDIKAGNRILRSAFNLTPAQLLFDRKVILGELNINCNCAACRDIKNNCEILDTVLCIDCGRFTVLQLVPSTFMVCTNCGHTTRGEAIEEMINGAVICSIFGENLYVLQDMKRLVKAVSRTLRKVLNPNHVYLYNAYKEIVLLYAAPVSVNTNEFKKALQNFQTCAKNRNGRFNAVEYVIDLIIICKACFSYLLINFSKLQKEERMRLLDYFSDVLKEVKDIAEYTFPPLLKVLSPIEFSLLKFRITQEVLSLED